MQLVVSIVEVRYVFTRFKAEKMQSVSAFVAFESISNLTIFSTSLIKKLLFREISYNFLIMVFITIASLSLSSNKLGNNVNPIQDGPFRGCSRMGGAKKNPP